ncbi:MAG: hypothetical protein WC570_00930 [Patescibacteria group bacterium]
MNINIKIVLVSVSFLMIILVGIAKGADNKYKSFGDRGVCQHVSGDPICTSTPPTISASKTSAGFSITATTKYGSNSFSAPYLDPNGPADCCSADLAWKAVVYRGFNSSNETTYTYNGHNIRIRYVPSFYHDTNSDYIGTIIKPDPVFNYDEARFNFADYAGNSTIIATWMGVRADGVLVKNAITDSDASLILCIYKSTNPIGCFGGAANPRPTAAEITSFRNFVNGFVSSASVNTIFYQTVWESNWGGGEACNFTGPAINNSFTGTINKNYVFDSNLKYRIGLHEQVGSENCIGDEVNSLDNFRWRTPVDLLITTPQPGQCGEANTHHFAYNEATYTSTYDQCNIGSPSSTAFPAQGSSAAWTCSGADGGSPSGTCTAYRAAALINGDCSSTKYLCDAGDATSSYDTIDYYKWDCIGRNGGTNAQCSIPKPGDCGGAATYYTETASFLTGRECDIGSVVDKSVSNLNPAPGGRTTWRCQVLPGGTKSPTCTATRELIGRCGVAQGEYLGSESTYRSPYCAAGTATSLDVNVNTGRPFPDFGDTIDEAWKCNGGAYGGASPTCSVSRKSMVDGACPECGTKYMNISISVPLVRCS